MSESLRGGARVASRRSTQRSSAAGAGFVTVLDLQEAAARRYFDAAGAPGRTLGLRASAPLRWP